jgi:ketosteroid isomerase-like protein
VISILQLKDLEMNRIFARTWLALLILGSAPAPAFAAKPAMPDNPETTVKALYAGFAAGDMAKILALIAPDVVWTYHAPVGLIPFAGTYKGREGVGDFFAADAKYVDVKGNDIKSFMKEGDQVAVFGEEHGMVRSNGKKFTATWVHVFTVRNGSITKFDEYIDSAAIYEALR